jgi:hypothetical protein
MCRFGNSFQWSASPTGMYGVQLTEDSFKNDFAFKIHFGVNVGR